MRNRTNNCSINNKTKMKKNNIYKPLHNDSKRKEKKKFIEFKRISNRNV